MDVDAIQGRVADLLLVAGDGYGGIATLFDRGAVEGAGATVRIAVVTVFLYNLCTCRAI